PVGALHAHHELIASNAGVVYKNVDLAEALKRSFGRRFDLRFLSYVHRKASGFTAFSNDLGFDLLELVAVTRGQRDLCTMCRKTQGTRPSDTLRGSGYQRYTTFQWFHVWV